MGNSSQMNQENAAEPQQESKVIDVEEIEEEQVQGNEEPQQNENELFFNVDKEEEGEDQEDIVI